MNIQIAYLQDYPEYIPLLAKWMLDEWGKYNPLSSEAKAQQKLKDHLNNDKLPLTLIALKDNKPIGTCSLRVNDGIRQDLTPWLGSLYVEPQYRGQGVGAQFVNEIIKKAQSLGYPTLYLLAFDKTLPNWYQSLGWHLIGQDQLNGFDVQVMQFIGYSL